MKFLLQKIPVLFMLGCLFAYGCSKEDQHTVTEISLIDKSRDSIRHYIQGNWQLVKTFGGWGGNSTTYYGNNYMSFFPNDSLYWVKNGFVMAKRGLL
jgi:hypothetical protein